MTTKMNMAELKAELSKRGKDAQGPNPFFPARSTACSIAKLPRSHVRQLACRPTRSHARCTRSHVRWLSTPPRPPATSARPLARFHGHPSARPPPARPPFLLQPACVSACPHAHTLRMPAAFAHMSASCPPARMTTAFARTPTRSHARHLAYNCMPAHPLACPLHTLACPLALHPATPARSRGP